jgi:hypothetical protein
MIDHFAASPYHPHMTFQPADCPIPRAFITRPCAPDFTVSAAPTRRLAQTF